MCRRFSISIADIIQGRGSRKGSFRLVLLEFRYTTLPFFPSPYDERPACSC